MKTIAVANQKGGVGKSTTVHALGAGLAARDKKVLFIDLDVQGNLSDSLGAALQPEGLAALLSGRVPPEQRAAALGALILPGGRGDLIPASPLLASADLSVGGVGKESRLKELLAPVRDRYDCILIDTPPSLGILTINALTAADGALIPALADPYSLQGISQLYDTIGAVQEYTNPGLRVLGILLTRYNPRAVLNREVAELMRASAAEMDSRLFRTGIRECIALREAQASRVDIFSYAPKSNACADYNALLDEIQADLEET